MGGESAWSVRSLARCVWVRVDIDMYYGLYRWGELELFDVDSWCLVLFVVIWLAFGYVLAHA
jgi:hypothetical protein